MRHFSFVILLLALLLVVSFQSEVRALALKNAGMIALTRILGSEHDRPIEAEAASNYLKAALVQNSGLPRVQLVVGWLEDYQRRAAEADQNNARLQLVETARQMNPLSEEVEQQLAVLSAEEGWVEAELSLIKSYQHEQNGADFEQAMARLLQWRPEHENERSFEWGGWQIEGYNWRTLSAGLNAEAYLVLFWRNPDVEGNDNFSLHPDQGLYFIGNRLFQVIKAQNLLADGDFEWLQFDEISTKPVGYGHMFGKKDLGSDGYRLLNAGMDQRDTVAQVTNTFGETILYVYPPKIQKGSVYLLLGKLRSNGGGFYGAREFIEGKNRFTMMVVNLSNSQWAAYARLFEPATAGTGGIYFYFGVLANPKFSWAQFNDLGVFEIEFLPPVERE